MIKELFTIGTFCQEAFNKLISNNMQASGRMQYTNYFKRKLKTEQQIGLWVGLADAYGTEIAANAGCD